MTEIVRYSLMGREDMSIGNDTYQVQLADGSVVNLSQVMIYEYAQDVGAIDGIVITVKEQNPYQAGYLVYVKAAHSNTGATYMYVNGTGPKQVYKFSNQALVQGDIVVGEIVGLLYDGAAWQLVSPPASVSAGGNNLWSGTNTFGILNYAQDGGSTDAYAISLNPSITGYTAGMVVYFKANTANNGAATLNINGFGAKTIKKYVSTDLDTGDIKAQQIVAVLYDGVYFQLLNLIGNIIDNVSTNTTVSNTVTATDIYSSTIPANTLGTKTVLKLTLFCRVSTTSTPNLSITATYGGGGIQTGPVAFGAAVSNNPLKFVLYVIADGATNSQEIMGELFSIDSSATANKTLHVMDTSTQAIDSTANQTLLVRWTWGTASSSNTMTMRHAILERLV